MTSLDYAWDEPVLPPYIMLTVKGAGSSEIICNMNDFQDSKQLYYENFIYIAAAYTFSGYGVVSFYSLNDCHFTPFESIYNSGKLLLTI